MKIRFVHVSDSHGNFPPLGTGDVVVHSGDLMPNRHDDADPFKPGTQWGKPEREMSFQERWIDANARRIKDWVGGRPFFFCPGNHDFYDPTARLVAEGVHIRHLGVKHIDYYDGVPLFGFPFCPSNVHPWNYATDPAGMEQEIARMRAILVNEREIILVAHCPPGGILDKSRSGTRYGNPALTDFLDHGGMDVKAVFCGHVHEDHAIWLDPDSHLLISNAATVVNHVEMQFSYDD